MRKTWQAKESQKVTRQIPITNLHIAPNNYNSQGSEQFSPQNQNIHILESFDQQSQSYSISIKDQQQSPKNKQKIDLIEESENNFNESKVGREQLLIAEMRENRDKLLKENKKIQQGQFQQKTNDQINQTPSKNIIIQSINGQISQKHEEEVQQKEHVKFDIKKIREQIQIQQQQRKLSPRLQQTRIKPIKVNKINQIPNAPKPSPEDKPQKQLKQDPKPVIQLSDCEQPCESLRIEEPQKSPELKLMITKCAEASEKSNSDQVDRKMISMQLNSDILTKSLGSAEYQQVVHRINDQNSNSTPNISSNSGSCQPRLASAFRINGHECKSIDAAGGLKDYSKATFNDVSKQQEQLEQFNSKEEILERTCSLQDGVQVISSHVPRTTLGFDQSKKLRALNTLPLPHDASVSDQINSDPSNLYSTPSVSQKNDQKMEEDVLNINKQESASKKNAQNSKTFRFSNIQRMSFGENAQARFKNLRMQCSATRLDNKLGLGQSEIRFTEVVSQSDKIDSDIPGDNSDQNLLAASSADVFGENSNASENQDSNETKSGIETEIEIELKKELKNVLRGKKLGEGTFGMVFEGMYKAQLKPGGSRIAQEIKANLPPSMAIKVVRTDNDDKIIAKLRHECNLLKTIDHPNIVKYYGFLEGDDKIESSIFMELMPHSLQTSYENFGPMNESILRRHTRQILEALCYLHNHEKKIIHGDLKAANILFDGKNLKLTDFGDSRQMQKKLPTIMNVSHSGVIYQDIKGSILWMAPEVIKQSPVGTRSDIWSLGCLLIELATANRPWPDIRDLGHLFNLILNKETPPIPEYLSDDAKDFIKSCLQYDKNDRPSAQELQAYRFVSQIEEASPQIKKPQQL